MLCGQCGAELETEAQFCGMCGNKLGRDSRSVVGESVQTHTAYVSSYKTGRLLVAAISLIGWLVVASGVIAFFAVSQIVSESFGSTAGKHLIPIAIGVLIGILGLGFVALGQFLRATIDTADFTGEILTLMKANKT